ncbi:Box C/D snoRNA protein 1, partial [Ophiophagus hannah]
MLIDFSLCGSPVSVASQISFFRCELCNTEAAKYRCPRCMKYSCSLACVKKHKALYSCNGIREKAAFVSVNEFSNLTLLSGKSISPIELLKVNFLRNRARRCKICLQTLPIGFTKRRENSTFYSNK